MAGSVNKVILIGNLGADPEIRTVTAGTEVCNLRLATSRSWTDNETGDRKESTQWHSVTIWDVNAVNYAKNYLSKGSQVFIEGKLETRKWQDQSGEDRYTTEVIIRPISGKLQGLSRNLNQSLEAPEEKIDTPDTSKPDWEDVPF